MNVSIECCILLFVVVIISIILTNIEKEVVYLLFGFLVIYYCKKSNKRFENENENENENSEEIESFNNNIYNVINNKINISNNQDDVRDVYNQDDNTADGLLYKALIRNGKKEKDSKDIRSSWNNHNVKKYFIDELEEQYNRNWWEDDDDVLKKNYKGVVPF